MVIGREGGGEGEGMVIGREGGRERGMVIGREGGGEAVQGTWDSPYI